MGSVSTCQPPRISYGIQRVQPSRELSFQRTDPWLVLFRLRLWPTRRPASWYVFSRKIFLLHYLLYDRLDTAKYVAGKDNAKTWTLDVLWFLPCSFCGCQCCSWVDIYRTTNWEEEEEVWSQYLLQQKLLWVNLRCGIDWPQQPYSQDDYLVCTQQLGARHQRASVES